MGKSSLVKKTGVILSVGAVGLFFFASKSPVWMLVAGFGLCLYGAGLFYSLLKNKFCVWEDRLFMVLMNRNLTVFLGSLQLSWQGQGGLGRGFHWQHGKNIAYQSSVNNIGTVLSFIGVSFCSVVMTQQFRFFLCCFTISFGSLLIMSAPLSV